MNQRKKIYHEPEVSRIYSFWNTKCKKGKCRISVKNEDQKNYLDQKYILCQEKLEK